MCTVHCTRVHSSIQFFWIFLKKLNSTHLYSLLRNQVWHLTYNNLRKLDVICNSISSIFCNFEDKCDECNLAYCYEHIPDHNCGSDPAGSSSSYSVRQVPRSNPLLHSSSVASNLFSTPSQDMERESDAVAKRRKIVQPTIDAAEIRLKWGPEEEIKGAK